MPERIYKLQPDRTLTLRGFDTFAAAASIHSATSNGFTVSGMFRDPADFCVAVLYDADNFYEHPSLKYLPDFDFSGLTLTFDMRYSDGVQPIDSPKFNWIDWATLDCLLADGTAPQVTLFHHATLLSTDFPAATGSLTVRTTPDGIQPFDRLTLCFQDIAYDYIVPNGHNTAEMQFFALGTGTAHSIGIADRSYDHTEIVAAGESSADVANALIALINAGNGDADVIASAGGTSNAVLLTIRTTVLNRQVSITTGSDRNADATLYRTTPELIAASLTDAINATDWNLNAPTQSVIATNSGAAINFMAARYGKVNVDGTGVTLASGARFAGLTAGSVVLLAGAAYTVATVNSPTGLTLTTPAPAATGIAYSAPRGGRDGNQITIFARAKTATLLADNPSIQLSGGNSDVTWRCSLDFTALKIDQIRQCWFTFAPSLTNGTAYTATEWQAVFSNWTLTGDENKRKLQVAGPGSVRIEENDAICAYTGNWTSEAGFYSRYFANACRVIGHSVTLSYTCSVIHNLYVGTSLYSDRATAGIQVDEDTETDLVCHLVTDSAIATRRLARQNVPAGRHTVTIRQKTAGVFYFDFLEAAVLSDIPARIETRTDISPALDFDTDHTYKLPPARLHWIFDQLGYAGAMNEYLGVFWWNQRIAVGGSFSTAQIQFSGVWAEGDKVEIVFSDTLLRKTVLATDDNAFIAAHFAAYINQNFVGSRAHSAADILTIFGRSPAPAYTVTVKVKATSATGAATIVQVPVAGVYPTWTVDDAATPILNRATSDWHADFFAQCAARGREITTAFSMELVLPPVETTARFPDTPSTAVSTSTGFGTLSSNHCAIGNARMLAYQKAAYRAIAKLQHDAGLTPSVQFGEFLWWFFPYLQNIPVGYASYTSPISIGTADANGLSTGQQVIVSGIQGNTAANGTWTITVVDPAHFTLNGSSANAAYTGGGNITGGGMAFYDAETSAAALTALGRPLHIFLTPDDDPTVNGSADAIFLRNRLRDHVAALVADLKSAFPTARCEVLWPDDVNHDTPVPTSGPYLGGRLNRFVNLPVEWQSKATSGLDTIKVEALAFGSAMRSLDLAQEAINLFPGFGWPVDSVRYLVPVFGSATPWFREVALARGAGLRTINLWAFDHICLYNLDVPEKALERRSFLLAA